MSLSCLTPRVRGVSSGSASTHSLDRPPKPRPPSFSDRRGRARGHFRRVTSARWMCLLPLDPVCGTSSMWQACALIQIYVESMSAPRRAGRGLPPPRYTCPRRVLYDPAHCGRAGGALKPHKSRLSTPPPTAAAARAPRGAHSPTGPTTGPNAGRGRAPSTPVSSAYPGCVLYRCVRYRDRTIYGGTVHGGGRGRGPRRLAGPSGDAHRATRHDRHATRGPRGPVPYTSTRYRPYSDRTTLLMVPGPAELRAEAALKAAARRRNRRPKATSCTSRRRWAEEAREVRAAQSEP